MLDEEAEVFVVKMWRLLIYELEAKKLGLLTKWKEVIVLGLYFAIGCCYIHPYMYDWLQSNLTNTWFGYYHIFRENEEPHEQPVSALGFVSMRKADLINSDWKSTVAPSRYCIESLSTRIFAPSFSMTLFQWNLYEKEYLFVIIYGIETSHPQLFPCPN